MGDVLQISERLNNDELIRRARDPAPADGGTVIRLKVAGGKELVVVDEPPHLLGEDEKAHIANLRLRSAQLRLNLPALQVAFDMLRSECSKPAGVIDSSESKRYQDTCYQGNELVMSIAGQLNSLQKNIIELERVVGDIDIT